ncbi:hypothetical protein HanIR_Chr05g0228181 [Helianthus annuus]|nr:hypothetical protein HanIR_Chr05g0228181 [Helianthus annuus]
MRWTSSSLRPVQLQPMIRMQNLWVFLLERICNPKHYQDLKSLIPQTYWCKAVRRRLLESCRTGGDKWFNLFCHPVTGDKDGDMGGVEPITIGLEF